MPTYMNMDISFVLQKGNKKTVKICDNLIHLSLSLLMTITHLNK